MNYAVFLLYNIIYRISISYISPQELNKLELDFMLS